LAPFWADEFDAHTVTAPPQRSTLAFS